MVKKICMFFLRLLNSFHWGYSPIMGCGNTVVIGPDCQSGRLMGLQSYYGVR